MLELLLYRFKTNEILLKQSSEKLRLVWVSLDIQFEGWKRCESNQGF